MPSNMPGLKFLLSIENKNLRDSLGQEEVRNL